MDKCAENAASGSSVNQDSGRVLRHLDHDVAQLTRIKSEPHKHLSRILPGKSRQLSLCVSPVEMLARREANFSGRSRFSSADSCHVLSRYLPTNGPSVIERMDSSCYVSQFSVDGSLFVAGFQVRSLRFGLFT